MRIGIIGGNGRMGRWMASFFLSHGFEVGISDKGTELSNQELAEGSDVLVFAVPISVTEEVIESLHPFSREDQLWMDVTSIKQPAVEAMLRSKAEVVGLHPMFSPTIGIKGQTVVVCDARTQKWNGWIDDLIGSSGGKVKKSTAVEHDRMMSVVQGLMHFNLISLGRTMSELGVDIQESLEFSSPVYRMRLAMIARVLAQDPELYADISIENEFTEEVMRAYINSIMALHMAVKDRDKEKFRRMFLEAAEHFGTFKERAMQETDAMLEGRF